AMKSSWEEAVVVNKEINERFPDDIDALNRLGRALMELGKYSEARAAYMKAQTIDSENTIAKKNIQRLSRLIDSDDYEENKPVHKVAPDLFIEETGKSKVINLFKPASESVLAKYSPGERVDLVTRGPHLLVTSIKGEYLGEVTVDRAIRLIKLISGGNLYEAAITSLGEGIKIIIKEVYQHPSQVGRLSFPIKGGEGLRPYVKGGLLRHDLEGDEEFGEDGDYTGEDEKEPGVFGEGVSIIEERINRVVADNKDDEEEF
ncbi:MAG: tetratricopeptide repeat protein, partial [Dehalococcoidia bacterium]|nr:tetratricopeptide repeat protein [Dehalococcoidia bacterium]